jgi:hypothetical protein
MNASRDRISHRGRAHIGARRGLASALAVAVAMIVSAPAGAETNVAGGWQGQAAEPAPGGQQVYFESIAAVGADDAWVAGSRRIDLPGVYEWRTWVQHWDGNRWNRVSTPDTEGAPAVNFLRDIDAADSATTVAVGSYSLDPGSTRPLLLLRQGADFRRVDIPLPVGAATAALETVAALSPTDIWAAGGYRTGGSFQSKPWAVHFDGATWQVVQVPAPSSCSQAEPADLAKSGARLVMSVQCDDIGRIVERVGSAWKSRGSIPVPLALTGLASTSGKLYATGNAVSGQQEARLFHRVPGGEWTTTTAPLNGAFNDIAAVPGRSRVTVVGSVPDPEVANRPFAATFSIRSGLRAQRTPVVAGYARAVALEPTGAAAWAAGIQFQPDRTAGLILRK